MKHIILFISAIAIAGSSFGQRSMHGHRSIVQHASEGAKVTATGDTLTLSNIPESDTVRMLYQHPDGNGYTTGTNAFGDIAFAERYEFDGNDSSVKILGVVAEFGGTVTTSSTKSVTLKIWQHGDLQYVAPNLYYLGYPTESIDSITVPITDLGITGSGGTAQTFMFDNPTGYLSGPFYAGYTIEYDYNTLNGDTVALMTSADGSRTTPDYKLRYVTDATGDTTAIDTFVVVQNATQWSDGKWRDNYSQNDSLYNHLAIFPIVVIGDPTGVKGVTRKQLTLFGAYPNPATNTATVRFSLASSANITLTLMDMTGKQLKTQSSIGLLKGEHTISVSVADLPTGQYLYVIRTNNGIGMAGKLEVGR